MKIKKVSDAYLRNILSLMSGTGLAQLIPILLSPILTRIYDPYQFGLFAFFFSISSILNIAAAGRLELAILIPKENKDSLLVLKSAILFTILFSILIIFTLLVFHIPLANSLSGKINFWHLYLLPVFSLIYGFYQSLNYWFNRNGNFRRLAKNRILQSFLTTFFQISLGLGLLNGSISLILGSLFGQLITLLFFLKDFLKDENLLYNLKLKELFLTIKKYKEFPLIDVPTMLLNLGANHLPNIFFNLLGFSNIAGNYYFTQRILQIPITFISGSVLDVFKEEASKKFRDFGECKDIFIKTAKVLILISIIPSVILFFFAEKIFVIFFGQAWETAGTFAKILTPALALRFVANPLSYMIYIGQRQIINLILMIFLFLGFVLIFVSNQNYFTIVKLISILYSVYYLLNLVIAAKISKAI